MLLALGWEVGGSVPVGAEMPGRISDWWAEEGGVGDEFWISASVSSSKRMSTMSGAWLMRRLSATLRLFIHRRYSL
jgi:hypothetical protein